VKRRKIVMEIKCCICGKELENQNSYDYYCSACNKKYGEYDDTTPTIQSMRKRKKYDDER
jgi:DNA-directed RNA polymerase subunit RPC12/RpoP